jgi:hypothetical protein
MRPSNQPKRTRVITKVGFNIDVEKMQEKWPSYFNENGNYIKVTDELYKIYPDIFGEIRECNISSNGDIIFYNQYDDELRRIVRFLLQEFLIKLKQGEQLR